MKQQKNKNNTEIALVPENSVGTVIEMTVTKKDIVELIVQKKECIIDDKINEVEKQFEIESKSILKNIEELEKLSIVLTKKEYSDSLKVLEKKDKMKFCSSTLMNNGCLYQFNNIIHAIRNEREYSSNSFNDGKVTVGGKIGNVLQYSYHNIDKEKILEEYKKQKHFEIVAELSSSNINNYNGRNMMTLFISKTDSFSRGGWDEVVNNNEMRKGHWNITHIIDAKKEKELNSLVEKLLNSFVSIISLSNEVLKLNRMKFALKKEEGKIRSSVITQALKNSEHGEDILKNIDKVVDSIDLTKFLA